MKHFQTTYSGEKNFREMISEWKTHVGAGSVLVHLFSDGAEKTEIQTACRILDEMMPEAEYVGSSGSGCIYEGRVSDRKSVV